MFKKALFAAIAASAIMVVAYPAAADTFTSPDGVLSIELPNESWKEIADPEKWLAFSDGANVLTIDHLSNGEKMPSLSVADDHYVNVYEAAFSTQNEVFIITGSVVDAAKIPEVANMIASAQVLQYDTKLAIKSQDANAGEFTIAPLSKTMYVTGDGVNVRSSYSTTSNILGGVGKYDAVVVTGSVQQGGKDYGWYQIAFNGGNGFVSAQFLTDTVPAGKTAVTASPTPTPAAGNSTRQYTGSAKTIYDENGNGFTVYQATDGLWYDTNGNAYDQASTYAFTAVGGTANYTVTKPAESQGITSTGYSVEVYWLNGNSETLTQYSDGYFYSGSGVRYSASNGVYNGADGTTLYTYVQNLGGDDADVPAEEQADAYLTSRGSGRPVDIYESDGEYYDSEGNEYYNNGDGTYSDDYGAIYDGVEN